MEVDYYSKYLKYKSKYLELKAQLGGADGKCVGYIKTKKCDCKSYNGDSPNEENKNPICNCTHPYLAHLRKETLGQQINNIGHSIRSKVKHAVGK